MIKRQMSEIEKTEADKVFAGVVDYGKIQISEDDEFPLRAEKIGAFVGRRDPRNTNAVTLGNRVRFSRVLKTRETDSEDENLRDMGWLIHELTHVWQFQTYGWIYLPQAIGAHLTKGQKAYQYSEKSTLEDRGEDLKVMWEQGIRFHNFNREQQGNITRDYYRRLEHSMDTSGWLLFIEDMRTL
ncbi:MAG: hypothetical protein GTO18_11040 [Anaerolineales bacterium]|nr:hypothetical protein [Anaerolineales bacterium]